MFWLWLAITIGLVIIGAVIYGEDGASSGIAVGLLIGLIMLSNNFLHQQSLVISETVDMYEDYHVCTVVKETWDDRYPEDITTTTTVDVCWERKDGTTVEYNNKEKN